LIGKKITLKKKEKNEEEEGRVARIYF